MTIVWILAWLKLSLKTIRPKLSRFYFCDKDAKTVLVIMFRFDIHSNIDVHYVCDKHTAISLSSSEKQTSGKNRH